MLGVPDGDGDGLLPPGVPLGEALGDPDGEVTAAWQLKQITHDLYRAPTLERAREVLSLLYAWADGAPIDPDALPPA